MTEAVRQSRRAVGKRPVRGTRASVRRRRPSAREAAFTLLEVMVSLGILAVALMAIGDLNGGAVRMHSYSKHLIVAVQLARGKMLDLQNDLRKDGLSDFSREYKGDFEDDDRPEYKWKAQVIKPEIDVEASKLVEMMAGGLGLGGQQGAPGQAGAQANPLMGGPMAGLIEAQVKQMTELIKSSLREVKLTVSWKEGAKEESFSVVEHVIILPDAQQKAVNDAQPMGGGAAAPGTGVPQPQQVQQQLQQLQQMQNGQLQDIQKKLQGAP